METKLVFDIKEEGVRMSYHSRIESKELPRHRRRVLGEPWK